MIKHIVAWKMKDGVSAEQKAEMKARLEALRDRVDELRKIEVGIDVSGETMSLVSEFASAGDLAVYQGHPAHLDVVTFIKPLVAERCVVDYEC
jgi:hypothetical protein